MRKVLVATAIAASVAVAGLAGPATGAEGDRDVPSADPGLTSMVAEDGGVGDVAAPGSDASQAAPTDTRITASLRRSARRALKASPIVRGHRPPKRERGEPYIPQSACYAYGLPGVVAFRDMLLKTFPRRPESLGIYNIGRGCNTEGISEHEEGRALDFEANVDNPTQHAQARRLLKYLTKKNGYNAKRWGILYIIFDQKIWGQYRPRWRWMSDRGSKTANHRDHIHFTFTWNGAVKRSSYWSGHTNRANYGPCAKYEGHFAAVRVRKLAKKPRRHGCGAAKPIPRSWDFTSSVMYWESNSRVEWLQQFLGEKGVFDEEATGDFGTSTFSAVRKWQKAHKLPQTGVWDPITQNESQRVVSRRFDTDITGWSGATVLRPGQLVRVPVRVLVRGVGYPQRAVLMQRRPADGSGKWETRYTLHTGSGGFVSVPLQPTEGAWDYRLVAVQTSYADKLRSTVREVTVIEPQPQPQPQPQP